MVPMGPNLVAKTLDIESLDIELWVLQKSTNTNVGLPTIVPPQCQTL
jgi:hypothetical protein